MSNNLTVMGLLYVPAIMVTLIVWVKSSEKRKRYQSQVEVYIKALELGQSVPADWFVERKEKKTSLVAGIICITSGIGLSLFAWLMVFLNNSIKDEFLVFFNFLESLGAIPFFIGIAFVIIHFMGRKKDDGEDAK